MEKHNPVQKEVAEKSLIFCDSVKSCCGPNPYCLGTYHILPTGRQVFKHCNCDDPAQS